LKIKTRAEWRNWLSQNFNTRHEVWLIYAKKSTDQQRIQYNDAVEEALCFGWIDSIHKTLDKDHTMQRFTPRKTKSIYSQPNKERLKWFVGNNLIHHSFLKKAREIMSKEYVFPTEILDAIKTDKTAWNYYNQFSDPYKRIGIVYIKSVRNNKPHILKETTGFLTGMIKSYE